MGRKGKHVRGGDGAKPHRASHRRRGQNAGRRRPLLLRVRRLRAETRHPAAGSIEAQVWDGSYVIEYRYDTGTVYGVFFTEGSQEDLESFYATGTGTNIRDRGVRRGNDPLVGYYGGAAATNLESVTLQEPVVNAGRSSVLAVTDPNLATGIDAMETVMLVTIQKGALDGEPGEGAGGTGGEEAAKPLKLMLSRGTEGAFPCASSKTARPRCRYRTTSSP